jgi:5-methylthioadenosine/S-adenosylhomocysteine deaminase
MRRIAVLSEELDLPIHTHVHETVAEIQQGLARNGARPIERLRALGVVGPRLIAVHCVHLQEPEIELFARENVSVAHCPTSNMKLASGIAPVALLRHAGVRVGVGTDGAASNNRLDVLAEARNAALLAKVTSGDAATLGALEAIEMATLAGARALGLEERIGSIAAGKAADLTAISLDAVETVPCFDAASHVVYAAGRENVTHVWVEGQARLVDRELRSIDEQDLREKARWWKEKLA